MYGAVLRRSQQPRLHGWCSISGSYLLPCPNQRQRFTLKTEHAYSRGSSWCLCVTDYRTWLANWPQNPIFYHHTGDAETPELQGWRGGEHFQRQQRHTWVCSEDLQVNEIQNRWRILPCQRNCLFKRGPVGMAAVPWASHKHSHNMKPSWKPCLVPAAQRCCSNRGSPQSAMGGHRHTASRQDVMLTGGHGSTWFQIHILDNKTSLGSLVNTNNLQFMGCHAIIAYINLK